MDVGIRDCRRGSLEYVERAAKGELIRITDPAQRAGAPALRIVAFDVRLAQVARGLGWTVVGA